MKLTRLLTRKICVLALGAASAVASLGAHAALIAPSFSSFGALPAATFGGSGIPNNAVAIFQSGGDLTMGLTATPRFGAPAVTNDGAGRFTAQPGVSSDPPSPADPFALWNLGFYIAGSDMSDLLFALFYDFDPAAGNDQSTHGSSGAPGIVLPDPFQDSINMGMDFLATAAPGIAPPAGSFDPNAVGEYSFALVAFSALGLEIGRAAIVVQVGQATVPLPGTLALAGLALFGVAGARRRR